MTVGDGRLAILDHDRTRPPQGLFVENSAVPPRTPIEAVGVRTFAPAPWLTPPPTKRKNFLRERDALTAAAGIAAIDEMIDGHGAVAPDCHRRSVAEVDLRAAIGTRVDAFAIFHAGSERQLRVDWPGGVPRAV